jgi:hypothetical protein
MLQGGKQTLSNQLLEVISTRGVMSLDDFSTVFDRLVPVTDGDNLSFARSNTLYALDALGHCEKDWGHRRVFACRPVLARLPAAGCPRVVLTGARTAQMVAEFKDFAKTHSDVAEFSCVPQTVGLPDVITLEVADEATLAQCTTQCRVPISGKHSAAWVLANISGCLVDYAATLMWKPDAPLNWRLRVFDTRLAYFYRADDHIAAALLTANSRLTEHTNPVTQQRQCRWTKDGSYALVARDWGRWLALTAANEQVLLYDSRRQRLSVPSSVPLPRLLARAATLCSGHAAYADKALHRNIYDSVPPALAELIARKCGQTHTPAKLERELDHA